MSWSIMATNCKLYKFWLAFSIFYAKLVSKQILFLIKIPTKQEFTTAVMSHRGFEVSQNLINSALGILGSWVLPANQEDDQDL